MPVCVRLVCSSSNRTVFSITYIFKKLDNTRNLKKDKIKATG